MTKEQEEKLFKLIDEYSYESDGGTLEDVDKVRNDICGFVGELEDDAFTQGRHGCAIDQESR